MAFGFGTPHFLGIDFGTASIKAVELSLENGRPVLANYGQVSLVDLENGTPSAGRSYDEEIALHLQALLKRMKPKGQSVSVAMPAFTGLILVIEFPMMNEAELKDAISFEVHKYISSSLDKVSLNWEVLGIKDTPTGEKKMEVLLVVALNKEVSRYQSYVAGTSLQIHFLELETFSIVRSIVGDDPGLVLVIDIGSRATNLVLVEGGLIKVSRNLDVGGRDITRVIAEGLNITEDRAKILKRSGKDFLIAPEVTLIFPALQAIASEAERMLLASQAKHSGVQCKGIILSGGTAQLTGLTQYYTNLLKLPVVIGNPWKQIQYDPRLTEKISELGTSFAVALGLALRGADTVLKPSSGQTHSPAPQKKFSFKGLLTKKL